MKKSVKFLSLVLTLTLLTVVCLPYFTVSAATDKTLKFKDDGTFRIMQMTDTHCTDQFYEELPEYIGKVLDDYQPDLVVFTGDNVTGGWFMSTPLSVKSAIDQLIAPLEERNIPFTVTYGNHDWQTVCPKALQTDFYQMHDNCIMEDGFTYLHRTANSYYLIKDHTGEKNLFNIWMIDSGSRNTDDEQNPVKEEQIAWYEETSAALTEENGAPIPSIVFQHVPVEEMRKLLTPATKDTEGAVRCSAFGDEVYFTVNREVATGNLVGGISIPYYNSGEYDSWVKMGDVVGAFFGHDHMNDIYGKTEEGITLGSTRCTGFQSRGEEGKQGVRIIDLNEADPANFTTYMVYCEDYLDEPFPEAKKEYDYVTRLLKIFEYVYDFLVG